MGAVSCDLSTALDDVSIHEITHMDPHNNLSPWEVHGRLIISVGVVFQWQGIKSRYSFVTDTRPKSLSVEIFPSLMDEKEKGHETCHTSPSVMVEDSSSTNFPEEVHLSIRRFHGDMERVQVDKSHQFPVTHFGDDSFEEAEKRTYGGEKDTCMMGDSRT